MKMGKRKK
jgi:hypothetical protein